MTTANEAPQRSPIEKQLNVGLMVVMVLAALIIVYALAYVSASWDGDQDRTRFEALQIAMVFLFIPGVVVFFTARSARRRLKAQVVSARLYGTLAGVFAMLAALPILATVIGLASLVAGLFTLTASLLLKKDRLA
ncbi:hypothetical protein ISU07_22275 [Nocardioides islandensis]|jgi:lysylphosphatidylglycerol synthetase-like protein (DUF2156 family)|uniref:Uncharacterized protein n=1 Tax=Nocardioides islandensis TaxID=433663 RepID=A0A930YMQ3_9ACTN|nr:hypothetical protein [Nocardioides islandensis]MBF4765870.1 hypothetical protein [Nocardioides islandensis]